jgi:MFS family permease
VLLCFIPESPTWLFGKGFSKRADDNAVSLRGRSFSQFALHTSETHGLKKFLESVRKLFRIIMIKPTLIGILLHTAAQFSGVNAIIFFSTKIFRSSGVDNPAIVSVATGFVFVVSTFVGLLLIERLGRRVLFLVSTIGAGVSFIALTTTMVIKNNAPNVNETAANVFAVLFVFSYITFYSIGLGPLPWLMLSEIYPYNLKSFYYGIITALGWTCKLTVTFTFPFLFAAIGEFTFLIFSAYMFFAALVGIFLLPETKGKSLEELTAHLE